MFTPAHIIVNTATLFRNNPKNILPAIIGAIIPDLPMVSLFLWEMVIRKTPFSIITTEKYYSTSWQNIIDSFNSLPLLVAALTIAVILKKNWFKILFLSMILHILLDFPFHSEDAHRSFLPFSHFRFTSPISYWNVSEYGMYVALAEFITVLVSSIYLSKKTNKIWLKILLFSVSTIYGLCYLFLFLLPNI